MSGHVLTKFDSLMLSIKKFLPTLTAPTHHICEYCSLSNRIQMPIVTCALNAMICFCHSINFMIKMLWSGHAANAKLDLWHHQIALWQLSVTRNDLGEIWLSDGWHPRHLPTSLCLLETCHLFKIFCIFSAQLLTHSHRDEIHSRILV
jgi:hypothetical protein